MPFDLFLSHAEQWDALESAPPISPTLLESLMAGAPVGRREDGAWRVPHPNEGDPWCTMAMRGPNLVLSASYSYRRFVRNFADMFDQALAMARHVGLRVFDEVRGTEVVAAEVNEFLTKGSSYFELVVGTFAETRRKIDQNAMAPLEYPVGPIDLVSDYFVVHVRGVGDPTTKQVLQVIEGALGARTVTVAADRALLVHAADTRGFLARSLSRESPTACAKILVRPDGALQVWPTWCTSFAEGARAVLAAANATRAAFGGELTLGGRKVDDAFAAEIAERAGGLGVDMFEWLQGRSSG